MLLCGFEGAYYGLVVAEVWGIHGTRRFGHRWGVMSRLGGDWWYSRAAVGCDGDRVVIVIVA